jgi:hypothetical protein
MTVLALGFAVISVAQSRSSGASDTVPLICSKPAVKPATLIISCADANSEFTDLHWYGWGDATTYATGTARWNDCTPTCVAGTWRSNPVTIWAWDLQDRKGYTLYTKVRTDSRLLTDVSLRGFVGGVWAHS